MSLMPAAAKNVALVKVGVKTMVKNRWSKSPHAGEMETVKIEQAIPLLMNVDRSTYMVSIVPKHVANLSNDSSVDPKLFKQIGWRLLAEDSWLRNAG